MEVLNIDIEEGTDQVVSIVYRDGSTGLPVNVMGYSAILQARSNFGESTGPLLELSTANGRIVLGGILGTVDISFLPSDTAMTSTSSPWVIASYDLILIDTNGKRIKMVKGFISVPRSATI